MLAPSPTLRAKFPHSGSPADTVHNDPFDSAEDDVAIQKICRLNNIEPATLAAQPKSIVHLEICHYSIAYVPRLSMFRHLRSLAFIALDIDRLGSALSDCRMLERLWICETQIREISGLYNCQRLVHLYLYGNKLKTLQGIGNLPALKTLWLFDNELTSMETVTHLTSLEELNIANNLLEDVHNKTSQLNELKSLNLAGNLIRKLSAVLSLQKNTNLETLLLCDQNYAENPICRLPNYQTFVIHYLRHLKQLDFLVIGESIRKNVDNIFDQKRLFYEMRSRVIARNLALFRKHLSEITFECETSARVYISALNSIITEAGMAQQDDNLTPDQLSYIATLRQKLTDVQEPMVQLQEARAQVCSYLEQLAAVQTILMCLEFKTGGVLSFESLSEDEFWDIEDTFFDFIRSQNIEPLSVFRIKAGEVDNNLFDNVQRVVVRDTMPQELERILYQGECDNGNEESNLTETMTAHENATLSVIMAQCKVNGNKPDDEEEENDNRPLVQNLSAIVLFHSSPGQDSILKKMYQVLSYRALTTSTKELPLAELQSVIQSVLQPQQQEQEQYVTPPWLSSIHSTRQAIDFQSTLTQTITTLNLSGLGLKTIPDLVPLLCLRELTLSHNQLNSISEFIAKLPALEHLDMSWNKVQTIGDHVQPSLVSLNLAGNCLNSKNILKLPSYCANVQTLDVRYNLHKISHYFDYLMMHLIQLSYFSGQNVVRKPKQPLTTETMLVHAFDPVENSFGFARSMDLSQITRLSLDTCTITDADVPTLNRLTSIQELTLSNNYIVDISMLEPLACLSALDLSGNMISSVCLKTTQLTKLNLSSNCLNSLTWLTTPLADTLTWLDVSGNMLQDITPLAAVTQLTHLFIGANNVPSLTMLMSLRELSDLAVIDLGGNQLQEEPLYRAFAIFHLSSLQILDGETVTEEELLASKEQFLGNLTYELLMEKVGHDAFHELATLDLRNCRLRKVSCFRTADCMNLQHVNLDNNALTDISDLSKLRGLRLLSLSGNRLEALLVADCNRTGDLWEALPVLWPCLEELHLNGNLISKISLLYLHRLPSLKVLYLNDNRINKIDGLDRSKQLTRLYLDNNQIRAIDSNSFAALVHLRELSMNENRLKSLVNLTGLDKLKHLHLINNRLANSADIKCINIPALTSISLRGNVMARNPVYRLWLICQLPTLQRIDEMDVTSGEREKARIYEEERNQSNALLSPAPSQSILSLSATGVTTKQVLKFTNVKFDGSDLAVGKSFSAATSSYP